MKLLVAACRLVATVVIFRGERTTTASGTEIPAYVDADDAAVAIRIIGLLHRVNREGDEAAAGGRRGNLGRRVAAEAQDAKQWAAKGRHLLSSYVLPVASSSGNG